MVQSSTTNSLYLHIGHPKTGSSYIQSSFACSIDELLGQGIIYPETKNTERAAKGEVTNGNFESFLDSLNSDSVLEKRPYNRILYSSEMLFQSLRDEGFQESFREFITKNDFVSVKILLFLRDPVSHACSSYQQNIKRAGLNQSIKYISCENYKTPKTVNIILDFLDSVQNIDVTVKNYSREQDQILSVVEEWLELDSGTLMLPRVTLVNRSLTIGELELQRFVNIALGPSGNVLADHLCNNLPDIRPDEVRPSITTQEKLWDDLIPEINRVNDRVASADRYDRKRDISEPKQYADDMFLFSSNQLEVIASCLARPTQDVAQLRSKVTDLQKRLKARIEREPEREKMIAKVKVELFELRTQINTHLKRVDRSDETASKIMKRLNNAFSKIKAIMWL